jgi:hypothetical protein
MHSAHALEPVANDGWPEAPVPGACGSLSLVQRGCTWFCAPAIGFPTGYRSPRRYGCISAIGTRARRAMTSSATIDIR